MNRILERNREAEWVRIQPGVVLDELNNALAEEGLSFAANVAPSDRATLGGMSNTDTCGKGSRIYGKTSDHVLETRLILVDGSRWTASLCDQEMLWALKTQRYRRPYPPRSRRDDKRGTQMK